MSLTGLVFVFLQEERYVLRHMERQDPQGEENGDHNLASYQYMNRLAGSDPSLFQVKKLKTLLQ